MALGTPTLATPTVSSSGGSVTSASFTPTASALLLAVAGCRLNAIPGPINVTGGSLTWSPLAAGLHDTGTGLRNRGATFGAIAVASPMTVQATSTSAARMVLTVLQITGHGGIPGNFAAADSAVGDPSMTLGSAPAASSTVVAAGSFNGTNAVSAPGTFLEIDELLATDLILHTCYDAVSPPTTITYSTINNNPSVGVAVEVSESTGGGLQPRNRATRFQHMLVR